MDEQQLQELVRGELERLSAKYPPPWTDAKSSSEGEGTMSTPETWRTEAAAKIQKHHWDVIQEQAEQAGDYLGWLRTAAMKEHHARADDYARKVRAAMNMISDRLERLDAIREMRDIYELAVSTDGSTPDA